jgi:hypothetical protein
MLAAAAAARGMVHRAGAAARAGAAQVVRVPSPEQPVLQTRAAVVAAAATVPLAARVAPAS